MYVGSLPATSNREDWRLAMQLVDADSGDTIDISLCRITMTVTRSMRNQSYSSVSAVLTGSTDTGEIAIASDMSFQWLFTATQMSRLCQGQYDVGLRISQDDRVSQLLIGTVDVFEGIDAQ
jgi:hypothetical protein